MVIGGVVWLGLGLVLGPIMTERNFHGVSKQDRPGSFAAMRQQVRDATRASRGRPVLLGLAGATLFVALGSEGLDRLGQAHLLELSGSTVAWLGALAIVATLGSIALTELFRRRVTRGIRPGSAGCCCGCTRRWSSGWASSRWPARSGWRRRCGC